ncbi:MAG: AmmeMemoRadiSam system protein B [Planctomycetes bacterium]|uniref:AmmeMemoRadiSam system protein B n=1 Tax=Candidatus Wunengus californicus TaxID=3367619 RepID=UPI004026706E|nr:AmmeMemoRadiSam system protein B [Planctomycetota bacterium]
MKSSILLMSLLIIILTPSILFAEAELQQLWEPQVAGRFYPGNETVLKEQINTFLKKIPKQSLKGKPVAIISPHAGYQYSGQVAAYGYSAIKDAGFNRVIILAPSHFMSGKRFRGVSILKVKNFKTPLGVIPVDEDACNQLLNTSKELKPDASHQAIKLFGSYEGAYKGEHSLETQLPFLQTAINTFKVVPIIIGVLIDNDYDQVADTIRPLMDDKTLLVVSSDFTHYGEGYGYVPFKKDIEKNIRALDYGAFDKILSKDFDGLRIYRKETGINACGIIPIALLLKLLPREAQGEILNYDTSGHQSNDFSFSVSYASVIFTKPSEIKSGHYIPKTETLDDNQFFCLTNKEKTLLLSLARNTLETYIKTGSPPKLDKIEYEVTPKLKEKYGVFVTLKKHGELRGCIGYIIPKSPLSHAVIENTINSSANDWRFSPVEAKEIPDITIEISVLSQTKKINRPDEFVVGKEGIIIRKGLASAVFLPQVATEQGWDRVETLCHLCRKAGLSPDAWKDDDTEFYVFTADVFHEGEKT